MRPYLAAVAAGDLRGGVTDAAAASEALLKGVPEGPLRSLLTERMAEICGPPAQKEGEGWPDIGDYLNSSVDMEVACSELFQVTLTG